MKSRFIDTCMNCGERLPEPPHVFQGVLICKDCYKMVSHFVEKTKKEMQQLFLVYTDMLRVALVKGELRPPPAPPGKEMPPLELAKAFQRLVEKIGGARDNASKRAHGNGQVCEVRVDNERDPNGETPSR